MNIASRGSACSTLIFGNVQVNNNNSIETAIAHIVRTLHIQMQYAEREKEVFWHYDPRSSFKGERERLDGYKTEDFACFFTTILQGYTKSIEALRILGFVVDDSVPMFNKKNGTCVYPVYGYVKTVLENLKKYDSSGLLIKKEEKPLVEKAKPRRKKAAVEIVPVIPVEVAA